MLPTDEYTALADRSDFKQTRSYSGICTVIIIYQSTFALEIKRFFTDTDVPNTTIAAPTEEQMRIAWWHLSVNDMDKQRVNPREATAQVNR